MRLPLLAAFAAVAVLATAPSARAADVEANKKLVRTLIDEVMNKRQLDAVDRFLAPDFVEHNPNLPQGREGRKQFAAAVHIDRIANGKVAEHWDVVDSLPRAVALGLVPPPKTPTVVVPPKSQ